MTMQVTLDAYEKNSSDHFIIEGSVNLQVDPCGLGIAKVPILQIDVSDCRTLDGKVFLKVSDLIRAVNCLTNKDQSSDQQP